MFLARFFKTATASVKAFAPGDTIKDDAKTDAPCDDDTLTFDASGDISEGDAHSLDVACTEKDGLKPEGLELAPDPPDDVTTDPMDDPLGGNLFETLRLDSHALASDGADGVSGDDPVARHLGADNSSDAETAQADPVPDWTDAAHLVFGGDGVETPLPDAADAADVFAIGDYIGSAVVPTITDFDPALDELQLVYDARTVDDPTVTTRLDGDVLTLELSGAVVARLEGISSIDPALIRLIPISA